MTITKTIVDTNKKAATTAGIITAGNIANKQILKMVKPKLPMMARGYADSAIGHLVIANIFSIAVKQYKPDNKIANAVAEGMMVAAYASAAAELNIEGMLDEVLSSVTGNKKVMEQLAE